MSAKPVFKIGHLPITDHLVLGVTKAKVAKDVEKLEHCSFETISMAGWNDVGDAMTAGEIDIAFMLAPYAMELFHSQVPLKLIMLAHRDGSIIVTNKKANITKLEDFKGKTVLIPYHLSVHHMLFDKLLKEAGMTVGPGKDVVFEVVAPGQIPQFIEWDEAGDIGGYIVAEPFGSVVIAKGMGDQFKLSQEIWPDHPCCVVVAKEEICQKYPEAIQELVTSFVKSGQLIHEKPESAVKVAAAFLGQTEEVMSRVLMSGTKVSYKALKPNLAELDTMQTYLTTKISALSGKIDLEKFYDSRFLK
ncbi:MAG: ABC transporter substrate-binding protein [Spirochaetales bacterium]